MEPSDPEREPDDVDDERDENAEAHGARVYSRGGRTSTLRGRAHGSLGRGRARTDPSRSPLDDGDAHPPPARELERAGGVDGEGAVVHEVIGHADDHVQKWVTAPRAVKRRCLRSVAVRVIAARKAGAAAVLAVACVSEPSSARKKLTSPSA